MTKVSIPYNSSRLSVIQLCCFTNLWPKDYFVASIDLRVGFDIFEVTQDYVNMFDLVVSAPPYDQFTRANNHNWQLYPEKFINIAQRCLDLSVNSGKPWILENPPGRIEKFLPGLTQFRRITWNCPESNKEYVLYSNMLLLSPYTMRYGAGDCNANLTKKQREAWLPQLVDYFVNYIRL